MYANVQKSSTSDVRDLRVAGGLWLRELREKAHLSQRDLARETKIGYYTFISQLENGRGRLPPDRYEIWANALKLDPKEFTRELMRYYDPITHRILFGD